ncbi:MAG: polyphosphate polymerase domain-containing protein [Eubacteriales bacterium]
MPISVFKRYEKKFLLNRQQYREIMDFLQDYMTFDKYCVNEQVYSLLNIYFDTPDNVLIGRSTDKPLYKEKLRLRSYFPPEDENSKVFFEIKQKYDGCVTKRRVVMRYGEALHLMRTHQPPEQLADPSYINVQVAKEIAKMFERYPGLAPVTFIAYDRIAMFGKEDPELRITFDRNIRTRRENPTFEYGIDGEQLLPEDQYLMEIKIPMAMPMWLARYLSTHHIYNSSFSKYGKEYEYRVTDDKNQITALTSED